MKKKEDLRLDYYRETGDTWINTQSEPDIDYVEWLENKVLSELRSAKEEVKSAEILTPEQIRDKYTRAWFNEDDNLDDPNTGHMPWPEVLEALKECASQFQSVQPWGESLNTDKRVITTTDNPIQSVKGEGERMATDFLKKELDSRTGENHSFEEYRLKDYSFGLGTISEWMESYKHSESKEQNLFSALNDFVWKTFPDASSNDHLKKLKIEADEAMQDNRDISEYADCLMAVYGAASKAGFSFNELLRAGFEKLELNKTRKWKRLSDGTYQHI